MPSGKHNSPKPKRVLPKSAQMLIGEEVISDAEAEKLKKNMREETQKTKSKKPITGRPPVNFDKKLFENLCHIWCTWDELESILGADKETISDWCKREYGLPFSTIYKRYSDGGKASLRRSQVNLSKSNAAMAIWLGKNKLEQKESFGIDHHKLGLLITNSINDLKMDDDE